MLKAIWAYILAKLRINSPVKNAIKKHLSKRIKEAEARVREDVDFAQAEFTKLVADAANKFVDDKQAALSRQVKQLIDKLAD